MNVQRKASAFGVATIIRPSEGKPCAAMILGDYGFSISALGRLQGNDHLAACRDVGSLFDDWDKSITQLTNLIDQVGACGLESEKWKTCRDSAERIKFLPPIPWPRQIFCIGANYRKHVVELMVDQEIHDGAGRANPEEIRIAAEHMMEARIAHGEPYAFSKLPTAVTGPYDDVVLPTHAVELDWELELGVVIAAKVSHVDRSDAMDYVAGYLIVNDLTARNLVLRRDMKVIGTDWLRSKCSPTFMPTGPYIVPSRFVEDPHDLHLVLKLNGQVMQDESTADMIFDIPRQIEYLSKYVELLPGDIIATGSPAGNGTHWNRFLRPGDVLEATIDGLGFQRNTCVADCRTVRTSFELFTL